MVSNIDRNSWAQSMKFYVSNGAPSNQRNVMTLLGDGHVGIGTTAPAANLHIQNSYDWSFYIDGQADVWMAGEGGNGMHINTNNEYSSGGNATYGLNVRNETGPILYASDRMHVGIRTDNPTAVLHVIGDAFKTAGGDHWNATSDKRIKEDIISIGSGLERIMQLNPVSFKYNKDYRDANEIDEVRDYYGFIAQEFKTVFPDDVTQGEQSYGNVENVLELNTSSVEPHIVKAIQEQQKIIEAQQAE
ncbi:MAG: tail fiber domain-containing protein, partial [Gammaproteobacteria bacterium]|nr:tail fiber domain-containing protein [Gammaproteobacteria bacterium]